MRRFLISILLVGILSVSFASASHLPVDGGTIQVFEIRVTFPSPTPTTTPTPEPTELPADPGCTYSQGYWKNHSKEWPVESLVIGGQLYSKQELIALLNEPAKGDMSVMLAYQYIAALLNVENGADPTEIVDALYQAEVFFVLHPPKSNPQGDARKEGEQLKNILEQFNEGKLGPGKCEEGEQKDGEPAVEMLLTETPTPTPTLTPTETETVEPPARGEGEPEATATHTATGGAVEGDGQPVESSPEPPANDTPEPTATLPPTEPPAPPTDTPEPTSTPEPPPTEPEATESTEPVATEGTENTEG